MPDYIFTIFKRYNPSWVLFPRYILISNSHAYKNVFQIPIVFQLTIPQLKINYVHHSPFFICSSCCLHSVYSYACWNLDQENYWWTSQSSFYFQMYTQYWWYLTPLNIWGSTVLHPCDRYDQNYSNFSILTAPLFPLSMS